MSINQQKLIRPTIYKYKNQLGIDSIEDIEIIDYGINSVRKIGKIQIKEINKAQIAKITKNARIDGNFVVVSFGYHRKLVEEVKKIKGVSFDWPEKEWSLPLTKNNLEDIENFLSTWGFPELNTSNLEVKEELPTERIEYKDGVMEFFFTYNYETVQDVKTIPGRKFNYSTKTWKAELNERSVVKLIEFLDNHKEFSVPKEIDKDIEINLSKIEQKAKLMAQNSINSRSMYSELEVEGFKGVLRPFQKAGVKYITDNKKVIVGDEMGLGKTIEAIASIEKQVSYPALIVCPNSLKYNWQREFNRFVNRKVQIINSDTDFSSLDDDIEVFIINYNSLIKHLGNLESLNLKSLVSDESHYLKNGKSKRTKAFTKLANNNPEMVLLLSGTAIVNRVSELISPLQILGKLDEFGGFWKFATRYCGAHRTRFGLDMSGSQNLPELHEKLRSICYIRRNKADVLTELPEKSRQIIELDITNRRKYNKAESDLIDYLRNEISVNKEFVESISGLSKEEQDKAKKEWHLQKIQKAEAAEHLVRINELKKLVVEGKLEETKSWISDTIESGEKLVVFANHVSVVKELSEYFKCNKIDGSVSSEDRDKFVQDFQENENTKLIVINLAAGKEGLTLTAASKLAFVELGWTPGEHDQAEDRIHRIGQKNTANIYYLIGKNTIDNEIFDLISAKREITDSVNKGLNSTNSVSIMSELISKLIS